MRRGQRASEKSANRRLSSSSSTAAQSRSVNGKCTPHLTRGAASQKQLEHRGTIAKRQRQVHTTLDAGRRFTESCEGANGTMPNDSIAILTGATSIKEIEPRQLQRPLGRRSRLPT